MPRQARSLSVSEVRSKSKTVGCHAVGGVPGLCLRVVKQGDALSAYWLVRKQGARSFKMHIGPYPEMPLKTAREEAARILLLHLKGVDPIEQRNLKMNAHAEAAKKDEATLTIADLYQEYFSWKEQRGDWKRAGEARYKEEHRFAKHILPEGSDIVVATATPDEIAELMRPIWCEQAPTADKLLPRLRDFFSWATVVRKVRSTKLVNPAQGTRVKPLLPAKRKRKQTVHFPALDEEQLPRFMKELYAANGNAALCTLFAILTCSRSVNARTMTWDEVDLENRLWIIDKEEMKISSNGQHVIPLSDQAMDILRRAKEIGEYAGIEKHVFFSSTRLEDKGLSDKALSQVINGLHAKEKAQGNEGWIDRKQTAEMGVERVAVQHAIARSTFETWAQAHRKDPRTIELCLHHSVDLKLKSAYDRDDSIEHKRELLQEWADFAYSMIEQ